MTDRAPHQLDTQRVEALAGFFLRAIKEYYLTADDPFEVLNALAWATALVLAGCPDDRGRRFFDNSLDECINEAKEIADDDA